MRSSDRQRIIFSSSLMACSGGSGSGETHSSTASSDSAACAGSRPSRRNSLLMRNRAMRHNHGLSFSGSRNSASCCQALTKVCWARSSLWLTFPVAQYASEEIKV